MINEDFLRELGLDEEVIAKIMAKASEENDKLKFEEILKAAIEKLNPYDTEVVLKLFNAEGLEMEDEAALEDKLMEFKEAYPFLFKEDKLPQIISSTKNRNNISSEDFKKMSYKERTELYKKNPNLYRTLLNA